MTFLEAIKEELVMEAEGTRKMLALVPADKHDWAPHVKSMKIMDLAKHIAHIPSWISTTLRTEVLDLADNPFQPKGIKNAEELVEYFNQNVEGSLKDLSEFKDEILEGSWQMNQGDIVIMKLTKYQTIRHAFGQMIHHRAQLGVYLRLLDIPIPGVYGPSADEMNS